MMGIDNSAEQMEDPLTEVKLTTTSPPKQLLGMARGKDPRPCQIAVPILGLCSLYPPHQVRCLLLFSPGQKAC